MVSLVASTSFNFIAVFLDYLFAKVDTASNSINSAGVPKSNLWKTQNAYILSNK